MSNVRVLQRSFGGGEISPEMFGRIDDVKYQSGLAICRNFVVKPQGPVENRAGFSFVREVKDSTKRVGLIPFTYSVTQTMVIELGAGYFRFHTHGGTLLDGGTPYEIANPYAEADLFSIHYVQSADVLTLVHPNYAPRELRRLGATRWQLATIAFASPVATPKGVTATSNNKGTDYTYRYVVTALDAEGKTESAPSSAGICTNNLFANGGANTIAWSASSGASRYNVYKEQGGLYGYIGQTAGTSLVDDNIAPDLSVTPPIYEAVFNAAGDYPAAVSYFEQRRCFAGTINKPQNIWMTRSGTESVMSYSLPVRSDDRVAFRVAAREANAIRHIVPLTELLLLTSSGEWRVASVNSDAVTPTTISVRPQSYVGATEVQPVVVNNTAIYGAARGGHVRELAYNWQANGFVTGDLSLRAAHLFDNLDILDMAYAKAPQPIVWFISSSGKLLGLTYVPEQHIGAWHQHDTEGVFESCAVVAEGNEDRLYVVVRRTIGGKQVRYIERMASRQFDVQADAFFVDSGLTYSGEPVTHISGLEHLEGKTVSILADGAVHPQRVVRAGAIDLDVQARTVHVGLPITADLQTLPVTMQLDDSFGQGRVKNINKLWLRVHRSSGIFAGPRADALTEVKQRTSEPYGSPPALKSEEIPLVLSPKWGDSGQLFVRQADPLPLTVVSMTAELAIGA
ncbi:phage tail protein [Bordetella bronchiseptica]